MKKAKFNKSYESHTLVSEDEHVVERSVMIVIYTLHCLSQEMQSEGIFSVSYTYVLIFCNEHLPLV